MAADADLPCSKAAGNELCCFLLLKPSAAKYLLEGTTGTAALADASSPSDASLGGLRKMVIAAQMLKKSPVSLRFSRRNSGLLLA